MTQPIKPPAFQTLNQRLEKITSTEEIDTQIALAHRQARAIKKKAKALFVQCKTLDEKQSVSRVYNRAITKAENVAFQLKINYFALEDLITSNQPATALIKSQP